MNEPRTSRDALIAEMLGDVGRLHDELGKLRESLPAMADDVEARLSIVFGSAVKTAESLKAQSAAILSQTEQSATATMERKATELTSHFVKTIGEAAQKATNQGISETVLAAARQLVEAAGYVKASSTVFKRVGLRIFVIALVAAFVGSILAVVAVTKFHLADTVSAISAEDKEHIMRDQRLLQMWDQLSPSTREDIIKHYHEPN